MNTNDEAVTYLLDNTDKINWCSFSENTNQRAVEYMIQHPHLIDWHAFSRNANETAITYMLTRPENVQWYWLMENTILFMEEYNKKVASFLFRETREHKRLDVFLTIYNLL